MSEVRPGVLNRYVEDAHALAAVQICRPSLHPFKHSSDFKPLPPIASPASGGTADQSSTKPEEDNCHPDKSDRPSSRLLGSGRSPSLVSLPHPPCLTARQFSLLNLLEELEGVVSSQAAIEGQLRALQQERRLPPPVATLPHSIRSTHPALRTHTSPPPPHPGSHESKVPRVLSSPFPSCATAA
jgi:hypothetical protein